MKWTKKEKDIVKKYYALYGSTGPKGCVKRIAKLGVDRSRRAVTLMAWKMGLKYNGKKKGCYKKGNVPVNKGKKMSPELYAKVQKTMFKKGNLPHNTLYNGALSYRRENDDISYWYVRLSKQNWKLLHRVIFENVNNVKLRSDQVVRFKDGNTNNIHPDNLIQISPQENMTLNNPKLHYPPEVVAAIKLNNQIKKKIKSYAKKQNKRFK